MITDNEILEFINDPSFTKISQVGKTLKQTIIEILTDRKKCQN